METLWLLIPIFAIVIIIVIISEAAWKEKIKSIKTDFGLIENCLYDVTQNNGRTTKNLSFISIYRGNKSANGNINLLFRKLTTYRGSATYRDVVIKYNSIWKVTKINQGDLL